MSDKRLRISLIIPAYNEEKQLAACLQSVAGQSEQPFEVIVVDNNSRDGTIAAARRFPFVRVVHEPRQGRVYARSTGFNAARGDILARIDADTVLPAGWLAHVREFYQHGQHADAAWTGGGLFYNVRLPRLVSAAYAVMAFGLNRLLVGHYSLWGSNMALTRRQWQQVAGDVCLRNDIHEDLDLAIHLHRHGTKIFYDRQWKICAELRRVHSDRHELWDYLQWWPRTLRAHRQWTWPICWVFGALGLYMAASLLACMDWLLRAVARLFGRSHTG